MNTMNTIINQTIARYYYLIAPIIHLAARKQNPYGKPYIQYSIYRVKPVVLLSQICLLRTSPECLHPIHRHFQGGPR